jgi:hypothetical protein
MFQRQRADDVSLNATPFPPHLAWQIMDQWTAKSMQLLFDRGDQPPAIKLSQAGYVSRDNETRVYRRRWNPHADGKSVYRQAKKRNNWQWA